MRERRREERGKGKGDDGMKEGRRRIKEKKEVRRIKRRTREEERGMMEGKERNEGKGKEK